MFDYKPMPTAIPGGIYSSSPLFGIINFSWLKIPISEAFIICYLAMDLVGEIRKVNFILFFMAFIKYIIKIRFINLDF